VEKKVKLEDTDASTYFGTSNKINRTAVPPRKKGTAKRENDDFIVDDDEFEFDNDLMEEIETPATVRNSTNGVKRENVKTTSSEPATKRTVKSEPAKRKLEVTSDEEDDFVDPKPAPKTTRSTPKKAKPEVPQVTKEPTPAKKTPIKTPSKPVSKATKKPDPKNAEEDPERKAILENIETVALPEAESTGDTK
jgi:hypothetical protein